MLRAAIYARYSSDNQNDKSVEDQIDLCRELCEREGLTIVAVFDDRAISGASVINRPGYQALMRAAEAKSFDVLVAEDMDRVFRDQGDYHHARKRLDHRGMVRSGRHAGGKAYGYKPVLGRPGELEVVEEQAEVVRRIFKEFAQGYTARDIAGHLNADKVAPPSGLRWNASTIHGSTQRGNGILLNELYAGEIVWNKVTMVKDPSTGKRLSRPNPPAKHRRAPAPHLRIIDKATWEAAQLKRRTRVTGKPPVRVVRMLSGLLRCPTCGGGMGSVGLHRGEPRVQCSTYRESGSCTNSRMVHRRGIKREIERFLDSIAQGVPADTIAPRIQALEAEKGSVAQQLAAADSDQKVVTIHPAAIKNYLADVSLMREALEDDKAAERPELIEPLRRLVHSVVVLAEPGVKGFEVEIKGRLHELINRPLVGGGRMVAREGLATRSQISSTKTMKRGAKRRLCPRP